MKESLSTKEIIKDTLLNLLREQNYSQIQMKKIAERANVGRRTLYRYFQTKDDIVKYISDSLMDEFAVGRRTLYRYFQTKDDIVKYISDSLMDEFANALLENDAIGLEQTTKTYFFFWEKNIEIFHCLDDSHLLHHIEDHLAEYIMQVALKTKMKDVDMSLQQILLEMPKQEIYGFYFTIAGYWELTKRWMREENRDTPEEISRLVLEILAEK